MPSYTSYFFSVMPDSTFVATPPFLAGQEACLAALIAAFAAVVVEVQPEK